MLKASTFDYFRTALNTVQRLPLQLPDSACLLTFQINQLKGVCFLFNASPLPHIQVFFFVCLFICFWVSGHLYSHSRNFYLISILKWQFGKCESMSEVFFIYNKLKTNCKDNRDKQKTCFLKGKNLCSINTKIKPYIFGVPTMAQWKLI